jgi:hypothetical protein
LPYAFTSGQQWRLNTNTGTGFTIYTSGDSPIAYAEIDGNWTGADTTAVTIDGWTTDSGRYIQVYTTGTARHSGKWDASAYNMTLSEGTCIAILERYTKFIGLQAACLGSGNIVAIRDSLTTGNAFVDSCIVRGNPSGTNDTLPHIGISVSISGIVQNCNAYYCLGVNVNSAGICLLANSCACYNCTVYNSKLGFYGTNSLAINCLAQSCTGGFGTFSGSSRYNCSDIGPVPGSFSRTGTVLFMDAANGDFSLAYNDTVARAQGTGLSHLFLYDIANISRGTGEVWDIGAFSYISGSYPVTFNMPWTMGFFVPSF